MVFIVSEIGLNHGGSLAKAKKMIVLSKEAGASAVKFQVFDKEDYVREDIKKCWLSREQLKVLKEYADIVGIEWFATPEKPEHVDFLESLGVNKYKIRHTDCHNKELLKRVAATGKQVIISVTEDVKASKIVDFFVGKSKHYPIVLHCPNGFPPKLNQIHLYELLMNGGFSNHYPGILPCLIAVAFEAKLLEVHVKLDDNCIDAGVSIDFNQLAELVKQARQVEEML